MSKCKHNSERMCLPCFAAEMKRDLPDIEKAWND